jgi:hypothetical protein
MIKHFAFNTIVISRMSKIYTCTTFWGGVNILASDSLLDYATTSNFIEHIRKILMCSMFDFCD